MSPHHFINVSIASVFFIAISLCSFAPKAYAATRYWVGGGSSANWNATAPTNWGSASNVRDNASVPTASDDVVFDNSANGNSPCTISAAASANTFDATNYANTLTHNGFSLTVAGSITFGAGMAYTPLETSTVVMSATGTLTTNGKLMPLLSFTGGTQTLGDNLNFMASKVLTLSLSNTSLVMNGKSIAGNSAVNRIFIKSGTVGTGKPITVTGSFANADFQDITFSTSTNLDLSGITGNSGDAGGNTITGGGSVLTFTSAATQTATMATNKNWSDATIWTSRVPLPQDDVKLFGVTGGTLTADMPRLGKSIDWSGASGNPTWSFGSVANTVFGSITLVSGMTISGTQILTLQGRGTYTLTSAGKQYANPIKINAPSGTYTLSDDLTVAATSYFQLDNGGFNANNHNLTIGRFYSQNLGAGRTLTMGTGTWTLTTTAADALWQFTSATGLTFSGASSTIVVGSASANTRTFLGVGLTYGTLTYTIAGSTGKLTLNGNNSFDTINFSDITNARTLEFTAGTVTTFRGAGLVGNGASGRKLVLQSTGAFFTLTKTSGTVSVDWWNISNAHAGGGASFLAGTNSTDSGGNTGWVFTGPIGPSNLGPTAYVDGSFGSSTQPQLTFAISDTDGPATVKYQLQIDDTSDFSSPIVDYTSALAAQGTTSFAVGQATGTGSYAAGFSGQTLNEGNYYGQVKAIDSNGASGSYVPAHGGAVAFTVDRTAGSFDPWIMGYYLGYEKTAGSLLPSQIDFSHLTHIVFGAILPVSDGTLNTNFFIDATNGPALATDVAQRAHAAGRKALLMVGGAGSGSTGFAGAASDTYRATFVANLVSIMNQLGYDGVDIDWEPIPTDTTNYQKLIEDLRAASTTMILTTAVPQVNPNYQAAKPVFTTIWPLVNRINIMTYDMASNAIGWLSWHNTPLTGSTSQTPTTVDTSVNAYLVRGVPKERLGIGSPFYGQGWRGVTGPRQDLTGTMQVGNDSTLSYSTIMSSYYNAAAYHFDTLAKVPYLSFGPQTGPVGATFISYEDEQSVADKAKYIETQGLGGVIIWSLAEGRTIAGDQPLLSSWYEGLIPIATTPTPANAATSVATSTSLSWTAGSGATSHAVYFGTAASPGASEYQGNQSGTTYTPGTLAASTTYYWRIDEVNAVGTTTGTVWSFATVAAMTSTSSPASVSPSGGAGSCSNCGGKRRSDESASYSTASLVASTTAATSTSDSTTPSTTGFTCTITGESIDDVSAAGLVNLFVSLGIIPQDKARKACAALVSTGQKSTTAPAFIKFTTSLKLGSRGSEVRILQVFLNTHGFVVATSGPGSSGNETELYGILTKQAVARFQAAYAAEVLAPVGLTLPSGYFGPSSMRKANQIIGSR